MPFATSVNVYSDNTFTNINVYANYGLEIPIISTYMTQQEVLLSSNEQTANLVSLYFKTITTDYSLNNYM